MEARPDLSPKLTDAIVFYCAGASIGCALLILLGRAFLYELGRPVEIAAELSPLLFWGAGILLFFRPRAGYNAGLIAALLALPWFIQTEFSQATWNSWVLLNYESANNEISTTSQEYAVLTFATLKILAVILIVIAVACCALRRLPDRWLLWGVPLSRCRWPAFALGFVVLASWFGYSATPYGIPAYDHPADLELRILHVEKRGLRVHETTAAESKNGMIWIWQTDRRLFQYRFERQFASKDFSQSVIDRARALVRSPALWNLRTQSPRALRSWDAEGWYVVLKDSRILAYTSEYGTRPPDGVTQLFHEIETLPTRQGARSAVRDVCMGFCYDPIAALGFSVLRQRARLLDGNGH